MTRRDDAEILAVENLVKDFGGVRALDGVSLGFRAGTVHGVIGENGAGKSTLMKVLAGIHRPTSGRVVYRGEAVELSSPRRALGMGIVMIHQELNLVDDLSVAENLFLGREPRRRGVLDRGAMRAAAGVELARLGAGAIPPGVLVGSLSIAQKQLVEIAKATSHEEGARVMIMDEPTAVLTPPEAAALFAVIRRLRDQGVLVVLISHRLAEVRALCDVVSVLRDGRLVETLDPRTTDEAGLAERMVGRKLDEQYPSIAPPRADAEAALVVDGVSLPGVLDGVSFTVRKGEVFGLGGLVGAGRTELGETLVGLRGPRRGTVSVGGAPVRAGDRRGAAAAGLVYLSEDRKGRALTVGMGITENVTMVSMAGGRYCRTLARVIDRRGEERAAAGYRDSMGIRLGGLRDPVWTLSGGNQQKVAIAKWLEMAPAVMILDEPTRGVDVGAKREIYLLIKGLAESGKAVVMISSELPELLGMCHRIGVMREGRLAGILGRSGREGEETATEERVMYLASGVGRPARATA